MGLQFAFTGLMKKHLHSISSSDASFSRDLLASLLGGASAAIFVSPVEHVCYFILVTWSTNATLGDDSAANSRQSHRKHSRSHLAESGHLPRTVGHCREGLYLWYVPNHNTCNAHHCLVVGMLGVTPGLQDLLIHHHKVSEESASLCASIIGGALAALPSHPFDVIKTW